MAQQSSASRVAGIAYRTFEHNGTKYLLSKPLRVRNYQQEEAFVLSRRRDAGLFGLRVYRQLPASAQTALWAGCAIADMGGIPSQDEWTNYNASTWKTAFMFWNTLDNKHKIDPETREPIDLLEGVAWAVEFISNLPPKKQEELFILIAIVSQDNIIKNSSGPTADPADRAQSQPPESPNTTDGPPSTNTSETDTSTPPSK